jgi:membrane-bound metal-dependent hydrolase YbcI (DUF457 family)
MTWPTYTLLGISTSWLLSPLPPEVISHDFGTLAACAALGALLPDLDASESKIKHLKLLGTNFKPFLLPAQIVHRSDQHRGLLHSLWGLGMAGACAMPLVFWTGWSPVAALMLGYASHLLGDSATKSGIRLFYPQSKRFHLLPSLLRITTGSLAEETLIPLLALSVFFLLLTHLPHG